MPCASGMANAHQICLQTVCVGALFGGTCTELLLWGLASTWHNKLHVIIAQLLTEVCHNVETEPSLQSLSQEQLKLKTALQRGWSPS